MRIVRVRACLNAATGLMLFGLLAVGFGFEASAQNAGPEKPGDYPNRPITLIIPYAAGSGSEIGFRQVARAMEKVLGVSIVVENKPGAGHQIGLTELARAKPDGYTIGAVHAPLMQALYLDPALRAAFGWESFAPIALVNTRPTDMYVLGSSKIKSLEDAINEMKSRTVVVGGGPTLSSDHLAVLNFRRLTETEFRVVNFDEGNAPMDMAVQGGHVDIAVDNVGSHVQPMKEGRVRVLAVMDKTRSRFLPDVPTVEEATGAKVYAASSRGLAAPAGTPPEIVQYLSKVVEEAVKDTEFLALMEQQGTEPRYMNPDDFDSYWREVEETTKIMLPLAQAEIKKGG